MSEQLWSDERIDEMVFSDAVFDELTYNQEVHIASKIKVVRDEMQARIAELEAQLAAAQGWEPIEIVEPPSDDDDIAVVHFEYVMDGEAVGLFRRTQPQPAAGE